MKKKILIFLFLLPALFFSFAEHPLLEEAQLHLDKKYVYATAGEKTFDCSGFTFYCFKQVYGIELLRSARDQGYDKAYTKIETIEELLPGDLVCFNTVEDKDLSDHVGIYMGDGNFIHSSSGQGKVCISTLLEGYYNTHFSWGRRIIEEENNEAQQELYS